MTLIYKLIGRMDWLAACANGYFVGSQADLADGYIHFSTAGQIRQTAERHYRGVDDLLLLALDDETLGGAVKWEPARNGSLFPHVYGSIEPRLFTVCRPAPLDSEGTPIVGEP